MGPTFERTGRCTFYFSASETLDPDFGAVGADFWNVHGLPKHGQRVKLAGRFSAEVVADFPNAFGQFINEQRHFAGRAIPEVNPARAAGAGNQESGGGCAPGMMSVCPALITEPPSRLARAERGHSGAFGVGDFLKVYRRTRRRMSRTPPMCSSGQTSARRRRISALSRKAIRHCAIPRLRIRRA